MRVALLAITLALGACCSSQPPLETVSSFRLVTAAQLRRAYVDNPAAADQLYKNAPVSVAGTVLTVGTDATGTVSETIGVNASDNATPTIQASFTRETADLIRSAVAGSPAAARCDAGVQQHSADTIVLRGCHP